jgi:hypothetical protein
MSTYIRFPGRKISQSRLERYFTAKMMVEREAEDLLREVDSGAEIEAGACAVRIIEDRIGESVLRRLTVKRTR